MALANVAAELAQRGRRVLAVDFDLEAPGLDTFNLPRPRGVVPGIVDFVSEYLVTGQAPAVEDFVFESEGVGKDGGGLWIMPSGAHQGTYAKTLANIDWGELYERHDGYLLFEDLKEQWKACIKPDYVLIDSRTGHTDVGGICTRQLPDAVVFLFFPNAQNLRGLLKVVRDVRAESDTFSGKAVRMHFIMSNVPDLDDEDRILEESVSEFTTGLGFNDLELLVVHRYDSLSLLSQVVFTKDRPKSRLAKEYREITDQIIRHNPFDRFAVSNFLDFERPEFFVTEGRPKPEVVEYLAQVEKIHQDDGEMLFRLGAFRDAWWQPTEAVKLFDKAIKAGYRAPDVYLMRARARDRELADTDGARKDARYVIDSARVSSTHVLEALRIIGTENLKSVSDAKGLVSQPPEERVRISSQLNRSTSEASIALALVRPMQADASLSSALADEARQTLVLASIATGRFSDAIDAIEGRTPDVQAMEFFDAFNYGMAFWGQTGKIVADPFKRALECFRSAEIEDQRLNRLQCMAVAEWAVGQTKDAQRSAARARRQVQERLFPAFSCWRYLEVPGGEFERDIDEFLRMIAGDQSVKPRFLLPCKEAAP